MYPKAARELLAMNLPKLIFAISYKYLRLLILDVSFNRHNLLLKVKPY